MTLKGWTILCGILGSGLLAACASKDPQGTGVGSGDVIPPPPTPDGGSHGGEGTVIGLGNGGQGGAGSGAGGAGIPPEAICGQNALKAEALPVDMYVMFDQSSSMNDPLPDNSGTWWTAAQTAVSSFVNNSRATGMTVGIQYFPLRGVAPASCTAPYGTPEVELAPLPANSAALTASIQAHNPTAFTPTAPALQGAINHMKAWAPAHLAHAPVVVFVTDGFPTECDPQQVTDIAAIAKAAFETEPKVRTFVVGFNLGAAGENLKAIAKAGGTDKPFLINGGDIGTDFVNAMLSIASTPLQCSFDLPPPSDPKMALDPEMVDVLYTPNATQQAEHVVRLNNLGDCSLNGNQGWYYDSPSTPSKILVCPGTCSRFAAGVIRTVSGCKPVKIPTK